MDYIDGTNLSDYIKTSINETMLTKIKIIDSLLKIMSKIHETNIIHGDIHARNFIIDKDIIKVIDFGLKKCMIIGKL
jgi:tRNA A-37 threonylcarbamoyl transferase component Bud32